MGLGFREHSGMCTWSGWMRVLIESNIERGQWTVNEAWRRWRFDKGCQFIFLGRALETREAVQKSCTCDVGCNEAVDFDGKRWTKAVVGTYSGRWWLRMCVGGKG